ncbi:MAG: peroxiredoxin-like family protein [Phycisphaeraceae bacterium]
MPRHLPVLLVPVLLFAVGCGENGAPPTTPEAPADAITATTTPADLPAIEDVPDKAEDVQPLAVDQPAPAATLRSPAGDAVDLAQAYADGPTMLVFYRGGWCPYCNTQLGHLSEAHDELEAMGYQVYAISPDRPEKLRESQGEIDMDYQLLSDADMTLARAFGLAFRVDDDTIEQYHEYGIDLEDASGQSHHLLPVPAVILVDTAGVIRHVDYNPDYRERLDPAALLAAARSMQDD